MKEPLTEVKKAPEPEPVVVPTTLPPPANPNPNPNEAADEKEERRSNGAHTPVWALSSQEEQDGHVDQNVKAVQLAAN